MDHGRGRAVPTTEKYGLTKRIKLAVDQCWICPGVFPKAHMYFPLRKFNARQMGSLGVESNTYFEETL